MKADVKKFTVKRDQWLRGSTDSSGDPADSKLLNHAGQMCCLGFLGKACGYSEFSLQDQGDPAETVGEYVDRLYRAEADLWPVTILNAERYEVDMRLVSHTAMTPVCQTIIDVNDSAELTDEERERQLTELFKQAQIEVVFE